MALQYLPETSRIWTFISDRILSNEEVESLRAGLHEFVSDWKAHGSELKAGFEIFDNCFIAVAVDENFEAPSGCSIDKVFRLLKSWGENHHCDLLKRTILAVKMADGIKIGDQNQIREWYQSGIITDSTGTYNALVQDLGTLNRSLLVPFENSWMGKRIAV